MDRRLRILLIDDTRHALSCGLRTVLAPHHVEIASDALDGVYRIDCAVRPHDMILCDVGGGDLSGPLLWAYLSMGRATAAQRLILVASGPIPSEIQVLLGRVDAPCVPLRGDPRALDGLLARCVARTAPPRLRLVTGSARAPAS